ncbi:ADP-ribosylation factor family-domain-containing protein [Penicillium odoratum]|uniref:ADP-ribosylation factor family-domain-containing protein n=1 Tax=Penicillium odoratum TaxID=1167516 RepID=UPI0025480886|nr:ADP-ribosylation factor family-domain-containing protein [Penicillium odoratum]KAJ5777411.1 ADP-ribosylation factor family-domain-containing protein [Penicillium odoratum]
MGMTISRLLDNMGNEKETRIIIVGLEGAGKTTILQQLKSDAITTTFPIPGFSVKKIEHKNITFTAWNMDVRKEIRSLGRNYFHNTEGIIFVVDSNDPRIYEARVELEFLLQEDELKKALLLVVANKQDVADAMSTVEIYNSFDLQNVRQNKWYIQSACATSGDGLPEGLEWLSNNIKRAR